MAETLDDLYDGQGTREVKCTFCGEVLGELSDFEPGETISCDNCNSGDGDIEVEYEFVFEPTTARVYHIVCPGCEDEHTHRVETHRLSDDEGRRLRVCTECGYAHDLNDEDMIENVEIVDGNREVPKMRKLWVGGGN